MLPVLSCAQTTSSTACPPLAHSLSMGSRGSDVIALQRFLTTQFSGFDQSYVTGYFGPLTQDAVSQWQAEHGIVSAGTPQTTGWGSVGPRTAAAMGLCSAQPTNSAASASTTASKASLLQSLLAELQSLEAQIAALTAGANAATSSATVAASTENAGSGGSSQTSSAPVPAVTLTANGQQSLSVQTSNGIAYQNYTLAWTVSNASSCTLKTLTSSGTMNTSQSWPTTDGAGTSKWIGTNTLTCMNSAGSASASAVVSSAGGATPIDVFVIAGQSNAAGLPPTPALSPSCTTQSTAVPLLGTAYYYDQTSGTMKPIGATNCGGAWPAFATEYVKLTGHTIGLVQTALGSTALLPVADIGYGNWDPATSGGLFSKSITTTQAALAAMQADGYAPTVKGILWDEGESEISAMEEGNLTESNYQGEYPSALQTLYAYFKKDLALPSVPFFLFRTGTAAYSDDSLFELARSTEESTAASTPGMYVVFRKAVRFFSLGEMDTDLVWTGGGAVHYSQTGYDDMGTTGAQNVVDELNGQPIPTDDQHTLPPTICFLEATSSPLGSTQLVWWGVNIASGSINNGVGSVYGYGTTTVNPTQTTTYGAGFQSLENIPPGSCSATAVVSNQVPTVSIEANGESAYTLPQGATGYSLTWSATNASSCILSLSDGTTYQNWPLSGSGQSGPFVGTEILTCSNSAGSASASVTISL